MNYYEILNISRDADKPQVKRACFAMVKTHSPDKDPEAFKAIRLAYETLYDEKKRAEYDTYFGASGDTQDELLASRALLRQNKYKEAAAFLAELATKNPEAEVIRLNAEALWLCRKSGKAEALCKDLLDKNPQDIETLLLRAKIAASRGHTTKADAHYQAAIAIDSLNPKIWIDYTHYSLQHQKWMVSDIGLRAVLLNPDMFRDDYGLYLHCVCGSTNHSISLFHEAESVSSALLLCFSKFTEYFAADTNPDALTYQNAISTITHVIEEPEYIPYIEKLLSVLEECKHYDSEEDDFNDLRAGLAMQKLRADERIHDVLADLTGYFIAGDEDQDERLSMECYIVMKLPGIRKTIKTFRDEYPEHFNLHRQFYLDALNERKTEFLIDKYHAIHKRLRRMEDAFDDGEGDHSVFSPPETVKPYVRETPKVGRNDPCPCGSGKKYKKCCG